MGLVQAAVLVAFVVPIGANVTGEAPAYSWSPAQVDGGGFMTVLAPSPSSDGLWLAGSDVAGVFRSTDGGQVWTGASSGFEAMDQRKVGAIEWDPHDPQRAWACAGTDRARRPSGAVLRTTDAGVSWTTISTAAFCTGGVTTRTDVTQPHPRSTGRLLIADPTTNDRLWIGTLIDGVKRSTDGGVTWTSKGLAGLPIRGMALDPDDPNTLYVAVRTKSPPSGGVYRTTNANDATPTWTRLSGPTIAEELAIAGSRLYVAAGPQGVWRADLGSANPTLTRVGQGANGLPLVSDTDVMTVTASGTGSNVSVLAGIDQDAVCRGSFCPTLYRSTDGGATWQALPASAAGVHTQIGGPSGPQWRQADHPDTLLGGDTHLTSDVRVDPFDPSQLLLAGRAGIWRSTDDGANWYPVPRGLTVTFHGQPSTDPAQPGSVIVPTNDWELLGSTDDGTTVTGVALPAGTHDFATSARLTTDGVPAATTPLYLGEGPSDTGGGRADVFVQTSAGGRLTSLRFATAVKARGVLAVAARDVGNARVVVVLSRGKGVWRRVGNGPWKRAVSGPGGRDDPAVLARTGTLVWAGDGALYLADNGAAPSAGVWRSLDAGATWQQLTPNVMGIAVDPTAPHRLWLAGVDQVWRVDDARTGTTSDGHLVVNQITSRASARLVGVDRSGRVIVVTAQTPAAKLGDPGRHGEVFRSIDQGQTFVTVSTDSVSRGLVDPTAMAIGSSGVIHITTFGFGWWVGRPS